jgi:malate synthase
MEARSLPEGVVVTGAMTADFDSVLTPEALSFVAKLQRTFNQRRLDLLRKRAERQIAIDAGRLPDFPPETAHIRSDRSWRVAPIPADLQRRHIEITGPTDRKMLINALNSGADVFMADFEDANSPTWDNMIQGHLNLRAAIDHAITLATPDRVYRLNDQIAALLVRRRGFGFRLRLRFARRSLSHSPI